MMDGNNSGKEASTGWSSNGVGGGGGGVTIHTVMEKGWGDGMNLSDENKKERAFIDSAIEF